MMTTDELITWLSANTHLWSLEINPERAVHDPRESYLDHMIGLDLFEDSDPPREVLIAAPLLVEARAYPNTPIGFVEVRDVDVHTALRRLYEELST